MGRMTEECRLKLHAEQNDAGCHQQGAHITAPRARDLPENAEPDEAARQRGTVDRHGGFGDHARRDDAENSKLYPAR